MAKKILFIENESNLRQTIEEALTQEGCDVLCALDGEEGLETLKKEKPDLVLLDLILPKKDGFEILREIKEIKELKDIPVIVLTDLDGIGDVEKALSLGAATYLVKANCEPKDVLEKIQQILK